MADQPLNSQASGIQSLPNPPRSDRGHILPRRTTPEKSVTLQHHRLARDASLRASHPVEDNVATSVRRNSSGESSETRNSDPTKWFHASNRNATANFDDPNAMEVDPPFYQQETDSSNELELLSRVHSHYGQSLVGQAHLRPPVTRHSSSADDYRSVIDDLTIENKRLKEELRRYRQQESGMMKKDKLFEIKVHGLPNGKKRELEATLRDFAASLEGSSETASHDRRSKPGKHMKNLYAAREAMSKHPSSSSTNSRPVDSAYASNSTGPSTGAPQSSTGHSLHGRHSIPGLVRSQSSVDKQVESYLLDTPQGLIPRQTQAMTDREKKKLVVRRLEQLFTGKISAILQSQNPEAVREARIQSSNTSGKNVRSRGNMSASNSGGHAESGDGTGTGDGNSSGNREPSNESPPNDLPLEQRPTRPRDLDPDRVQIPGENLDYIRHLGIVKPEFLVDKKAMRHDVAVDADGWVYLNLLSNLAQLHIINVTPAFIRSAVSEKSTKFQLSPDGRKIRWRGGSDGTKFSSDSSADNNSQKSPSTDEETSGRGSKRKRRKTSSAAEILNMAESSRGSGRGSGSKSLQGQVSASSDSFHYKPIFARHGSSAETSSSEGMDSQASLDADNKSRNKSPWDLSGSGSGQRRKRRHDGAIIYYSGAPFCTDLSGDRGDISPTTYITSNGQERDLDLRAFRPIPHRSWSGSSMLVRPLSDDRGIVQEALGLDLDHMPGELVTDDDDDDSAIDLDFDFPWCDAPLSVSPIQFPLQPQLEPCGLGGVTPEDHFAVVCHTKHPVIKARGGKLPRVVRGGSEEILEAIAGRFASMSTSSPAPLHRTGERSPIQMTYLSGRLRRLEAVPLPPPATFVPPFSSDSSSEAYDDDLSSGEGEESDVEISSESLMSKAGNPRLSGESDLELENEAADVEEDSNLHENMVIGDLGSSPADLESPAVATAGEDHPESGYNSSLEDNEAPVS